MIREVEHKTELDRTVSHLIKRHKLKGTLADWRPGYTAELDTVLSRRCTEITGDEYKRVMKEEKVVSLRMNPEPKKTGRNKMRLLVKGFMEPPEWDGRTDSPTAMSSTVRQLIAMGRAEVIDGDLYMDVDDVLSIGDITTAEILRNGSALPAAGNGGEVPEDGLGTFAWLDSAQLISDLCIEQSLGRSARKRRRGLCSSYSGQT